MSKASKQQPRELQEEQIVYFLSNKHTNSQKPN